MLKQIKGSMKKLPVALAISALFATGAAQATVINFDSAPNQYWISSYSESGFTMALGGVAEGLGTLQEPVSYWNGNGTGRLLSWTNNGNNVSGFVLTQANGNLFSLNSFDFGNGYRAGNNDPDSLTITGITGLGQTVTANVPHPNLGIYSYYFDNSWSSISSATFVAHGLENRTIFDNINVNAAPVPEPETYAMLLAGLGLLGFTARRRKGQAA